LDTADVPGQPETPPGQSPGALDFDLDLGANTEPGEEAEWPTLSAVDIDLGAEIVAEPVSGSSAGQALVPSATVDDSAAAQPISPISPTIAASGEQVPEDVIDFDLDLPVDNEQIDSIETADGSKPLDFDFDLELPPPESVAAVPAPSQAAGAEPGGTADLVADQALPDLAATANQAGDAPALDETTRQEVATKLELAQAYEEMGDSEGARELLQEVLEEGDQAQRDAAKNKLAMLT
jgi:pilus assembly protein FimV